MDEPSGMPQGSQTPVQTVLELEVSDGGQPDADAASDGLAQIRPIVLEPVAMGGLAGASSVRVIASEYLTTFRALLDGVDLGAIELLVDDLRDVRTRGATVFVAGNGGSAATASHWVNDLSKATRPAGRPWLRVASLNDNVSWLTALANDEGYERVFAGQLESLGRAGDLLIVISASGNSPNVVRAIETADRMGIITRALLGFDGGRVLGMVHGSVWLPTPPGAYGLVETGHSLICDLVTACLAADRLPTDG